MRSLNYLYKTYPGIVFLGTNTKILIFLWHMIMICFISCSDSCPTLKHNNFFLVKQAVKYVSLHPSTVLSTSIQETNSVWFCNDLVPFPGMFPFHEKKTTKDTPSTTTKPERKQVLYQH